MRNVVVGVDAGGTSTRAACVDATGLCVGVGRSGPGNPLSSSVDIAVASVHEAIARSCGALAPELVMVTMAGGLSRVTHAPVGDGLGALGYRRVEFSSDVLAAFCSGTTSRDGRILLAGTGAVAARVRDLAMDRVLDGYGWLLGDLGSGFWIGREAVRACIADLDGSGVATALTGRVLDTAGVTGSGLEDGRLDIVTNLLAHVYRDLRPVQMARFAPAVLASPHDDVALGILHRAADHLLTTLACLDDGEPAGPTVLSGGVLNAPGPLSDRVRAAVPGWIAVGDGLAGAASLALRRVGVEVTDDVLGRIRATVADCGQQGL